ncbi:Smr protein/MutS2 [Afipia carboxidovorans OM5]|uniref:Smr domain protein n=1 Tax=Afipia carboxidovorans (strain ATCC 49405 / DSM 1227 / KCTC 32145 / OM5) TaxID=504832 RepID=B6JAL3_AFIC5|nr:Smr/MutS family protein [Afipia carboxidovorans]ACI91538.1 Smr protein/MutS2 [Afipia carboxidovorans OM5]AEI01297.1 Smr domain protein [Afipia carboxidovorans OM4]AEI04871.1 Smr domain protein [Afipia carboxidovorans OM5]
MKRGRPPDLSPPPARRRRALDAEERALWETVTKQIKPLRRRKPKELEVAAEAGEEVAAPQGARARSSRASEASKPTVTAPRPKAPPPLVTLGRRERTHLARGRKEIEARLDLHGMTQARAHRALIGFVTSSSENGLTFVLVITGKGRSGALDAERGVLRRQVPEWLGLPELRRFVVGFEEASIGHGGAGALYVRLRRAR